ncbi:MAG TPA: phosphoribosylglycinamide formyltransferase [Alphaproteobacteria bacterium]|nr:phosphoribosylglycinamide formyltransferase [Alphaproteobacteria bacterium]
MAKLRVGVLISGRGSNLKALLDTCFTPGFPAEVVAVVSNRPDAAGLKHAEALGVPAIALDHKAYDSREAFDDALHEALRIAGVEFICLAGYMRLLTARFIARWQDRIINIHPSLLPAFRGLNAHEQAIDAGVKLAGCTVHIVRPEVDSGPILVQAAVPVLDTDDAASLAARVLAAEHKIYPLALKLIAEQRVRIAGDKAFIDGLTDEEALAAQLISPAR